jgi:hypothetical protein
VQYLGHTHIKKKKKKERKENKNQVFCLATSVQAAVIKYPWTGVLNNRYLFLVVVDAESPRSRCQQIQFLVRGHFLG